MKRRDMMIVALLVAGMLFRTAGMDVAAEGTVSGGDAVAEGTVSSGDAVPLADPEVVSIQIPQKLNIVLDPWEMDGREQVYSEQYAIRNTGTEAGILKMSFWCVIPKGGEAVILPEKEGLHEGEGKSIYIEVIFGEDRVVLSQKVSEYRAELAPGESLQVRFSGEMNESASEPWRNGDIGIEGVYSWESAGTAEETIPMESKSQEE